MKRKIISRIVSRVINHEYISGSDGLSSLYYKWFPYTNEDLLMTLFAARKGNSPKRLVFCCDNYWATGGLCDRLQGAMTFYKFCRKYQIPFYINWTTPFQLSDYLEPNVVDWRCSLSVSDYRNSAWRFVPMMVNRGGVFSIF